MNENCQYAIGSRCNLNNNTGQLTLYSFKKAIEIELYEEKFKKFMPKGINKSPEILNTTMELKFQIENLNDTFINLLNEQKHLKKGKKC